MLLAFLALRPLAKADEYEAEIVVDTFDPERLARAIFEETNRVRREHGLFEFAPSEEADAAAAIQASLGFMPGLVPHTNPFWGVSTLAQRVERVGISAVRAGENAAKLPLINTEGEDQFGIRREAGETIPVHLETGKTFRRHSYRTCAADLVRRWMNSKGHRENVLSRTYRVLGCASRLMKLDELDQVYAVQVFVAPKPGRRRG
jgi:uncharacterized protein YkwD